MPLDIASNNPLLNQNTSIDNRLSQQQRASAENRREVELSPRESVESSVEEQQSQVRRAKEILELNQQNNPVRRDDGSDLNFQARRAVDTFSQINQQGNQQSAAELLGIDLFA